MANQQGVKTIKTLLATAAVLTALTSPVFAESVLIDNHAHGTITFTQLTVGCQSLDNTMDQPEAFRMARKSDSRYDCQFLDKEPLQVQKIAASDAWPKTYSAFCVKAKRQNDQFGKEIPQSCFWVIVEKTKYSVVWN
jgi:hypothetical protein